MGIDVFKIALKNTFVPLKVTLIPNVFLHLLLPLNLSSLCHPIEAVKQLCEQQINCFSEHRAYSFFLLLKTRSFIWFSEFFRLILILEFVKRFLFLRAVQDGAFSKLQQFTCCRCSRRAALTCVSSQLYSW